MIQRYDDNQGGEKPGDANAAADELLTGHKGTETQRQLMRQLTTTILNFAEEEAEKLGLTEAEMGSALAAAAATTAVLYFWQRTGHIQSSLVTTTWNTHLEMVQTAAAMGIIKNKGGK